MPNLKAVRTRIQSVISTQQITKAMKLVAAAKLRRAQDRIIQLRPYAGKLGGILSNLSQGVENDGLSPYTVQRAVENVLIVPITSNRGLCGPFNANILKGTMGLIRDEFSSELEQGKVQVFCIGKKAFEYFKRQKVKVLGERNSLWNDLNFTDVATVAEHIMEGYRKGDYDKVYLVYNEFKNPVVQVVQKEQFLPVAPPAEQAQVAQKGPQAEYLLEPSSAHIVQELIPKSLKIQLYKALLDSNASEHGARMTAMDNATSNANELLRSLKLSYNRARQAAITTELTEIVAGASALEN